MMFMRIAIILVLATELAFTQQLDRLGDALPEGSILRYGSVRLRHGHLVSGLAFSPDGKVLASSSGDRTVRLWDLQDGHELRRLMGNGSFDSVAISPDGRRVAAGCNDFGVYVWETDTGKPLHRLEGHQDEVRSVAFSPDGKVLASSAGSNSFARSGSKDNSIRLWEVDSGSSLAVLNGHTKAVHSIAFSGDGTRLASGSEDGTLRIWDVAARRELHALKDHKSEIWGIAYSRDGKTLASAGGIMAGESPDTDIRIWDAEKRKVLFRLKGRDDLIWALALSPDGRTLATDGPQITILWDVTTGKEKLRIPAIGGYGACYAFSPDGKVLALGTWNRLIRLFDTSTGKEIFDHAGHKGFTDALAISPDGKTIATLGCSREIIFWEAETARELRRLPSNLYINNTLRFSADGRTLTAAGREELSMIDVATAREIQHLKIPYGLLSPEGRWMAFGASRDIVGIPSAENPITLRDVLDDHANRTLSSKGETLDPRAFSPDGKLLAASSGREYFIFSLASGGLLQRWKNPGPEQHTAFSSDGRRLLIAGSDPKSNTSSVRIWEVFTGRMALGFTVDAPLSSVGFSPSSRLLVTVERDKLRVWDAGSGKELRRIGEPGASFGPAAFLPDGRLVTGMSDTSSLLWDLERRDLLQGGNMTEAEVLAAWKLLSDQDAAAAHPAIGALASQGLVPILKRALEALYPKVDETLTEKIARLDNNDPATRDKVTNELSALGAAAEPTLLKALDGLPSAEMSLRIRSLLEPLGTFPLRDGARVQAVRCVEVFERMGSPEAMKALEAVRLTAPWMVVRQEAAASVARLRARTP